MEMFIMSANLLMIQLHIERTTYLNSEFSVLFLIDANTAQKENISRRLGSERIASLPKKVITTMMIRPPDNCTYCVRSSFTHFGALTKAVRLFIASFYCQPMCLQLCRIDLNLKGPFSPPCVES